jgi:hypothetical protein|tara:strand:- start:1267 stop:2325 length:1059 start_codon:yes stop_codon:yes gene_type:complete
MGAYKTLNSQDIIISPLEVTKGFSFTGNALTASDVGVDRFLGAKFQTSSATGYITEFSQSSIYYSAQQLYYSNYISSSNGEVQKANIQKTNPDGTTQGKIDSNAFENFEQTDLNPEKYWPTSSYTANVLTSSLYGQAIYGEDVYGAPAKFDPTIGVVSIPKSLFGDYILPSSINITTPSGSYYDDGEGRLIRTNTNDTTTVVGNIIYGQGMIVFTGGNRKEGIGELGDWGSAEYGAGLYGGRTIGNNDVENIVNTVDITVSFSSSFTIYETQYKCTISENDFNYSQNPSTISGSSNDGTVYSYITGSYFSPYVTTVGLYNNSNELVAIGKMAQPLPTSRTTDTTILVNIDRQ